MLNDYINNFENILSTMLFISFKYLLIILIIFLILSLILLILGCLIKSNKIKLSFLKIVPYLTLGIIFLLMLPYLFVYLKTYLLQVSI